MTGESRRFALPTGSFKQESVFAHQRSVLRIIPVARCKFPRANGRIMIDCLLRVPAALVEPAGAQRLHWIGGVLGDRDKNPNKFKTGSVSWTRVHPALA